MALRATKAFGGKASGGKAAGGEAGKSAKAVRSGPAANPVRGEHEVTLGGTIYRLRPGYTAIAEIDAHHVGRQRSQHVGLRRLEPRPLLLRLIGRAHGAQLQAPSDDRVRGRV